MKKIVSLLIVFALILSFAACTEGGINPHAPGMTVNTEKPGGADATPAPDPADPAVGKADYCVELKPGETFKADLDFDGVDDDVSFIKLEDDSEYDDFYRVTVKLNGKDKEYSYETFGCYYCSVWIVDCDPEDGRLEVIATYEYDSDDSTSFVICPSEDGSKLVSEEGYCSISISDASPFTSEHGFQIYTRTDILGTFDVSGTAKAGPKGFYSTCEEYFYPISDEDYWGKLDLERDLEVKLVNEDGSIGADYTIPAGSQIRAYSTDLSSFAKVMTEDGLIGWVSVEIRTGEDWGIYINGINQDAYAFIPYSD